MTRVAVDLLGGDAAPDAVVDGVDLALRSRADLEVLLVGPPQAAGRLLDPRVTIVPAADRVAMHEDPAHAVHAKRESTIAVAMRLLRGSAADAVVSAGSTGATMTAAVVTLGRLPGLSRPALAAVLPTPQRPVVLLDVGANTGASADLLVQHALAGVAYARVRLGLPAPRVGLLTVGSEKGKGDALRRRVAGPLGTALTGVPAHYVGNVEAHDVPIGRVADVVVTDGFTGNVLLKGIEGTVAAMSEALGSAEGRTALRRYQPDRSGGAVLLGVDGVVVVGHGSSGPPAVAACIALAADSVRDALLPRLRGTLRSPEEPMGSGDGERHE